MSKREIYQWENKEIQDFNRSIIEEFRAHNGVVGGPFANIPLLLLTTIGRKSGLKRINPLAYIREGDRYIIIASFAGAPVNPPWYYNLLNDPHVVVEIGSESFAATATVLGEPERTELFNRMAALMPLFNDYRNRTSRVIPVVALTRATQAD